MAAPFTGGYGDFFGLNKTDMSGQNYILTQWSSEVLRLGRDRLVFSRFLNMTPPGIVMGKSKGDTFRIPIFPWLEEASATTALTEGTAIGLLSQATLNVYGTLDEYGAGMGMEAPLEYYVKFNMSANMIETLTDNRARVINELCRALIDNTTHKVYVGTGSLFFNRTTSPGTAHAAAGAINSTHVKAIYDHLKGKKVPRFGNGLYTITGNAAFLRPIKDEGVLTNYSYYNTSEFGNPLIYQTLGNWEGFSWVETEEGLTGSYAYVIAPEVGAQAYAKPISLYYYPDYNSDAGRLNVIKWHMIAGWGVTLRDYGTRAMKVITYW